MDWNALLVQPTQQFLSQLMSFLPSLLGALLILLVGWFVAKTVESLVTKLLKAMQLDKLADTIQLASVLTKGGIRHKFSELIGVIIYWLIMLAVLLTALNALQLTMAAQLLERVVLFLPTVIAALFLLIVGLFAASFLATIVRTAASNAGIHQAHLLGQTVQLIVIVFTIVASLQQLQIQLVGEAFLVVLGAIAFGLALAFGLGCKDLAGRWVGNLIEQFSSRRR